MGYAANSPDNGFVKIILTRDMKIVGAHIVGPYASMLVQPFVYLMSAGSPCRQLAGWSAAPTELDQKIRTACAHLGSVRPVTESMVIHPSMNELAAWAIEDVRWLD